VRNNVRIAADIASAAHAVASPRKQECLMRLRVTLRGFVLSCGCVGGVYQTYDERLAHLVDVPAASCTKPSHRAGTALTEADLLWLVQTTSDIAHAPAPLTDPHTRPARLID